MIPGCGTRHSPKEVYYLVAANMSTTYWQTALTGFKKAGAEYGVTARAVGPDKYDPQDALAELQTAVAAKPAGFCLGRGCRRTYARARCGGRCGYSCHYRRFRRRRQPKALLYRHQQPGCGRLGGRPVVEKLGGKGDVVIFTIAGQPTPKSG